MDTDGDEFILSSELDHLMNIDIDTEPDKIPKTRHETARDSENAGITPVKRQEKEKAPTSTAHEGLDSGYSTAHSSSLSTASISPHRLQKRIQTIITDIKTAGKTTDVTNTLDNSKQTNDRPAVPGTYNESEKENANKALPTQRQTNDDQKKRK
ncbi:uncharacterized protein LOC113464257 [Ceratina calcarata]|uniref:Uncharacterized protein LOC113464257 n=1 Tax=Ceratina calcarata TaxID=156304 RepID=A0AAJ7WAB3_9HYME|nr:uncharacterized protein LOC113464257 [Ceratina calcarata]